MVFKKNVSLSHSALKVPVNRGSRAFPAGAEGCRRFTSLSQNLHSTSTARCETFVKRQKLKNSLESPVEREL